MRQTDTNHGREKAREDTLRKDRPTACQTACWVMLHAESQTHDNQPASSPYLDSVLLCFVLFETGSHYVAQAILEPSVLCQSLVSTRIVDLNLLTFLMVEDTVW